MTTHHRFLLGLSFCIALAPASVLPERLDGWVRQTVAPVPIAPTGHSLLAEYGLKMSERAVYATGQTRIRSRSDEPGRSSLRATLETRRVTVDAFQFASAEGGHGAYLWLRPPHSVGSPLASYATRGNVFGESFAAVGGGVTILQWKNYLFRFYRAVPSKSAIEAMLDRLPGLDPTEIEPDACCRYFDHSSERLILGPVALARFAPRIPAPLDAFHPATKGRLTRWETPAGPMTRVILDYPRESVAIERLSALRSTSGIAARQTGRRLGIVLNAVDIEEASDLLSDIDERGGRAGQEPVGFDVSAMSCALTLEDGISAIFTASVLGAFFAGFRSIRQRNEPLPDRTISLRL
jgi:hypothetical protein